MLPRASVRKYLGSGLLLAMLALLVTVEIRHLHNFNSALPSQPLVCPLPPLAPPAPSAQQDSQEAPPSQALEPAPALPSVESPPPPPPPCLPCAPAPSCSPAPAPADSTPAAPPPRQERAAPPAEWKRKVLLTLDAEVYFGYCKLPHVVLSRRECADWLLLGRWRDTHGKNVTAGGLLHVLDTASKHGFKIVVFLDIFTTLLTGEDYLADVVQTIRGKGHEVQLHGHGIYGYHAQAVFGALPPPPHRFEFHRSQAHTDAYFKWLVDQARRIGITEPLAFRGGAYALSDHTLQALRAHGIKYDFSYNYAVKFPKPGMEMAMQYNSDADLGPFQWSNGVREIPVSTISFASHKYMHDDHSRVAHTRFITESIVLESNPWQKMELFWAIHGDDAPLVMVLHSFLFFQFSRGSTNEKQFEFDPVLNGGVPNTQLLTAFEHFLASAPPAVESITVGQLDALYNSGAIRFPLYRRSIALANVDSVVGAPSWYRASPPTNAPRHQCPRNRFLHPKTGRCVDAQSCPESHPFADPSALYCVKKCPPKTFADSCGRMCREEAVLCDVCTRSFHELSSALQGLATAAANSVPTVCLAGDIAVPSGSAPMDLSDARGFKLVGVSSEEDATVISGAPSGRLLEYMAGKARTTDSEALTAPKVAFTFQRLRFSEFSGNASGVVGSFTGAYARQLKVSFDRCEFLKNKFTGPEQSYGGAVALVDASAEFRSCVFEDNTASGTGAGILVHNSRLHVLQTKFHANKALGGSALTVLCTSAAFNCVSAVVHSVFWDNAVFPAQGALAGVTGPAVLVHSKGGGIADMGIVKSDFLVNECAAGSPMCATVAAVSETGGITSVALASCQIQDEGSGRSISGTGGASSTRVTLFDTLGVSYTDLTPVTFAITDHYKSIGDFCAHCAQALQGVSFCAFHPYISCAKVQAIGGLHLQRDGDALCPRGTLPARSVCVPNPA